jgi:hypothetical protein
MRCAVVGGIALAWPALLAAGGPASPTPGVCACAIAIEDGGWCDVHRIGYIGGVEVVSERVYTVLDAHGHALDLSTFECETCKAASRTDGFCAEHKIGFVGGLAFFSKLTYHLARAPRQAYSAITCPVCREHARSRGWCDACGVGMVGRSVFRDRKEFDEVEAALRLLEQANEAAAKCERCAVAIVADSSCVVHRLAYEGGRPHPIVPVAEAPAQKPD